MISPASASSVGNCLDEFERALRGFLAECRTGVLQRPQVSISAQQFEPPSEKNSAALTQMEP